MNPVSQSEFVVDGHAQPAIATPGTPSPTNRRADRRHPGGQGAVARAVALGLGAEPRRLPSWLLYDAAGSALFEEITQLPEYYLARAEAEIFARQGDQMVALAAGNGRRLSFAEIGAGTAIKTEALLEAALRAQGSCVYLACDISEIPLRQAQQRLRTRLPGADVRIVVGTHADAGPAIAALEDRQLLLWIGSSIGNHTDAEAAQLLAQMRRHLRSDALLVFGTDLVKDPRTLQRAYDDTRGVTAAFSKNLLLRLNREIDARFDVEAFRHVAEWNAEASNVEVYLESTRAQEVWVGAVGRHYGFGRGERIHTETCAKYDARRVQRILDAAGFASASTQLDSEGRFAVHLARVVSSDRGR
jgi:L-histidine N-alpha-methyltransferase